MTKMSWSVSIDGGTLGEGKGNNVKNASLQDGPSALTT